MMVDLNSILGGTALGAGIFGSLVGFLVIPLMIWGVFWKGWSLWRAAKNDAKVWFVVLLVLNTIGILDILYIFVFGKKKKSR